MDAGARATQEQLLRRAVYSRTASWTFCDFLLHSPEVRTLRGQLGSGGYVWKEMQPMPSKIFPNVLIFMMPKPFTRDFNGNDFAVAQLGLITSSAERVGEKLLK